MYKYQNRKYYCPDLRAYVTMHYVLANKDKVRVIDQKTKNDITDTQLRIIELQVELNSLQPKRKKGISDATTN